MPLTACAVQAWLYILYYMHASRAASVTELANCLFTAFSCTSKLEPSCAETHGFSLGIKLDMCENAQVEAPHSAFLAGQKFQPTKKMSRCLQGARPSQNLKEYFLTFEGISRNLKFKISTSKTKPWAYSCHKRASSMTHGALWCMQPGNSCASASLDITPSTFVQFEGNPVVFNPQPNIRWGAVDDQDYCSSLSLSYIQVYRKFLKPESFLGYTAKLFGSMDKLFSNKRWQLVFCVASASKRIRFNAPTH